MADMKSLVDNCGDESRSSNPILGFVDLLSKDKYKSRDLYSSKNGFNKHRKQQEPSFHNDGPLFSTKEFDEYNASLHREFDKTHERFRSNRSMDPNHKIRDYIYHDRENPVVDHIVRHHQHHLHRRTPSVESDWAQEYSKSNVDDEMNRFNHVYNQKNQLNHTWRREFLDNETYDRFNGIYQSKSFMKSEMNDLTNEFEQFKMKEKEDANEDDFHYDEEIQELASKFNAYQDPRFRQSEFFKLMAKIGEHKKDRWADDFINHSSSNKSTSQWTDDYISSYEKETLKNDWFDEYKEEESFLMNNEFIQSHEEHPLNTHSEQMDNIQSHFDDIWNDDEFIEHNEHELDTMIENPTPYPFARENEFLNQNDQDSFEAGLKLYKEGDLMGAIHAFEASVKQNNDDKMKSQAYYYLGMAQAENDRDDLAIIALLNSLKHDPNHRPSLLSLSVSYANELFCHKVFECLMKWLSLTEEYSWILEDCDDLIDDIENDHETVSEAFMRAARMRPNEPDPDVQIALGLLYNLTREYHRSIDCFKSALIKRPNDYQLWNKLGATQANYGKYEDAIESYFHALSIRPTYTRTRFNLGVSFVKLKEFTEAAKSILSALSINSDAIHIWDFLGMIFRKMGREDLREKSTRRDVNLFVEDFNF